MFPDLAETSTMAFPQRSYRYGAPLFITSVLVSMVSFQGRIFVGKARRKVVCATTYYAIEFTLSVIVICMDMSIWIYIAA